jgi:hypothetical protein
MDVQPAGVAVGVIKIEITNISKKTTNLEINNPMFGCHWGGLTLL